MSSIPSKLNAYGQYHTGTELTAGQKCALAGAGILGITFLVIGLLTQFNTNPQIYIPQALPIAFEAGGGALVLGDILALVYFAKKYYDKRKTLGDAFDNQSLKQLQCYQATFNSMIHAQPKKDRYSWFNIEATADHVAVYGVLEVNEGRYQRVVHLFSRAHVRKQYMDTLREKVAMPFAGRPEKGIFS